jgi:hypothetical protein
MLATAVATLVLAPGAIAHRPVFQTGVYTAKTSQHTTFKFKLVTHTAANHCGTKGGVYCFVAMSDPSMDEQCADGTHYGAGLFAVPNGFMSWRGSFAYHQNAQDSSPLIDFHAHASGAKVTGSFREVDPNSGPNGMVSCDSGTVTFTAKRA